MRVGEKEIVEVHIPRPAVTASQFPRPVNICRRGDGNINDAVFGIEEAAAAQQGQVVRMKPHPGQLTAQESRTYDSSFFLLFINVKAAKPRAITFFSKNAYISDASSRNRFADIDLDKYSKKAGNQGTGTIKTMPPSATTMSPYPPTTPIRPHPANCCH